MPGEALVTRKTRGRSTLRYSLKKSRGDLRGQIASAHRALAALTGLFFSETIRVFDELTARRFIAKRCD